MYTNGNLNVILNYSHLSVHFEHVINHCNVYFPWSEALFDSAIWLFHQPELPLGLVSMRVKKGKKKVCEVKMSHVQ